MLNTQRINEARKRKGWLKQDLARAAGIHPVTLSRLLAGDTDNPPTVKAICDALGISVEEVYSDRRAEVA